MQNSHIPTAAEMPQSQQTKTIVKLSHVSKTYGSGKNQVIALQNISLSIMSGEFLAIMGSSGSGKSTLLHCAAGLDAITGGQVEIDGQDIGKLRDSKLTNLRSQKIGFIFQAYNLIPVLNVQQNIILPLKVSSLKKVSHETQTLFAELTQIMGLDSFLDRLPAQISGGQQQRVAGARALITRPSIIFADEPTGNLDSKSGNSLLGFLDSANKHYRQTIVIVTHSVHVASYARRTIFIKDGQLIGQINRPATAAELAGVIGRLE